MCKYLLCIIGILLLLTGCNGGDGGSMASKDVSDSGNVAVLLTDGPADDYESIWIWITEISLLADDGDPVVVFESDDPNGWKADLLELRDEDAVVTVKDGIPAGHYSKIRLRVADIQLEPKSEEDQEAENVPCVDMEIKLPGGKIDLNPRGGFDVIPGETIAIRLDIDCDKSIQLHPAGKSGKCIFRPVVFVEIDSLDAIDECPRVTKGIIETILDEDTGFTLRLGDGRGLLTVLVDEYVVVFGENGEPVAPEELWAVLETGELVHVRGQLNNDGSLQASVIVVGRVVLVKGTVDTPYNEDSGLFTLDLMPPHAFAENTLAVEVGGDTLVLTGCDQPAAATDIQAGMMARVAGKVSLEDQSIKAIAVLLKELNVSGRLTSVSEPDQYGGYLLGVKVDEMETVEIDMPAGVEPRIENIGPVPIEELQRLTDCGQMVEVSITVASKDVSPMVASDVRVDAATVGGYLTDARPGDGEFAVFFILDGDTVVAVSSPPNIEPPSPGPMYGDSLVAIGLNACVEDEYDFLAYMVTIITEP